MWIVLFLSQFAWHARDSTRSEARRFGASLMLAGATAMGYHSLPKGRLRSGLRKLDHWTISLATSAMVPAILPTVSPVSADAASLMQDGTGKGHRGRPYASPLPTLCARHTERTGSPEEHAQRAAVDILTCNDCCVNLSARAVTLTLAVCAGCTTIVYGCASGHPLPADDGHDRQYRCRRVLLRKVVTISVAAGLCAHACALLSLEAYWKWPFCRSGLAARSILSVRRRHPHSRKHAPNHRVTSMWHAGQR